MAAVQDIWLVRHTQTTCNVKNQVCGAECNPPLAGDGVQHASKIAAVLAPRLFNAIYASPLQRAQQVAARIAEQRPATVVTDPRLNEISYGQWEKRSLSELDNLPEFQKFRNTPDIHGPPGGETVRDVARRVNGTLEDLAAYPCVCIVTHKTVHRIILCLLMKVPLRDYRRRFNVPSGCISHLEIRNGKAKLLQHTADC